MKKLVTEYTFRPASRQVVLWGYPTVNLKSLLLITNTTSNLIIYNFSDPTVGATVSNNVITLAYNTTSMSATDDLQIFYEDGEESRTHISGESGREASDVSDKEQMDVLIEILEELKMIRFMMGG